MRAGETPPPPGTPARPLRELSRVLAGCLLLVVGAHALGLLARGSAQLLRRFWAWWPPESLQPLPLGVAGLMMLVTAYALATRGSRMRNPELPKGRRFLPPLDLLLLQLGNVTFMAFALILAVVTLGLLSSALRALVTSPWLAKHGLAASLAVAVVAALLALRSSSRRSWDARRRRWAVRAAALGAAVGTFWLIGRGVERALLRLWLEDSPADLPTLASLYGLLWILLAGSVFLTRFERSASDSSQSTRFRSMLATTSLLAWAAYLGFLALYLYGVFLTLRGHLAPE